MANKHLIKIPNYINLFYSIKKKIIIFIGPLLTKTLKLNLQLFLHKTKNIIKVSSIPFLKMANHKKKKIKIYQGLIVALIKQFITESSVLLYQKLKLTGIGYRAFFVENFKKQLLLFKLGYSHFIYFKKPTEIEIYCLKTTKLFLYGNSYQYLTQTSSLIRSYRKPEPYKGKGILYNNEKIILKEGKKI